MDHQVLFLLIYTTTDCLFTLFFFIQIILFYIKLYKIIINLLLSIIIQFIVMNNSQYAKSIYIHKYIFMQMLHICYKDFYLSFLLVIYLNWGWFKVYRAKNYILCCTIRHTQHNSQLNGTTKLITYTVLTNFECFLNRHFVLPLFKWNSNSRWIIWNSSSFDSTRNFYYEYIM